MKGTAEFMAILLWLVGLVVIEGFWWKVLGFIFFPYAWYKAVEFLLQAAGLL